MVTRTIVRTPRKEKYWDTNHSGATGDVVVGDTITFNNIQVIDPDLAQDDGGHKDTVLKMVGTIMLGHNSIESVTRNHSMVLGIAWVNSQIASAGVGDSQIPDPNVNGPNEAPWLWRCRLTMVSTRALTTSFYPDQEGSFVRLDSTARRRAQTGDARLVLIGRHQSDGGGTSAPRLLWDLHALFARGG